MGQLTAASTIPSAPVLQWAAPRLRDLPWRRTRDPWWVLVSEVMLQQTQVDRVVPKWHDFVQRWPTPASCAAAPLGEVLTLWQGLGYPRRARSVHLAAAEITTLGCFPNTLDGLMALPGVGPYTARAVLAFAFEVDAAVVDTNVARVLARHGGGSLSAREAQAAADRALPTGSAWLWNQSMMDLGATVCTSRTPQCSSCPIQATCTYCGDGVDPAVGSAGVSGRQAPFAGSDRQARGRLMAALVQQPVHAGDAARVMQVAGGRASRLVEALEFDGLVRRQGEWLALPE